MFRAGVSLMQHVLDDLANSLFAVVMAWSTRHHVYQADPIEQFLTMERITLLPLQITCNLAMTVGVCVGVGVSGASWW